MISLMREKRRHGAPPSLILAAPACAFMAVMLALSGCTGGGEANGGTGGAPSGVGQSGTIGVEAAYSFMAATGAQRTESNAFYSEEATLENQLAARCMTGLGFGAADEPYIQYDDKYLDQEGPIAPGYAGFNTSAVPGLFDMTLLSRKGILIDPIPVGAPAPPGNLPLAVQKAINSDYIRCQRKAATSFARLNSDGSALNELWLREVSSIQASAPVQAATGKFGTCVREHGAPTLATSSPDHYALWLELMVRSDINQHGKAALIKSLVRIDRHWTIVFLTCADSLESLMQRLQMQAQKAFFQSHYQQIQALELLATRTVKSVDRSVSSSSTH